MIPASYKALACLYLSLCLVLVPAAAQETVEPVPSLPSDGETSINRYLEQITAHEQEHGAMDQQLGEMLLGLGLQYQALGEHEQAAQVLDRALHIKRTNEGIQNLTQVPILEALIQANTAARQWQELDDNYNLLLWVNQRNLASGDPDLLPVFTRVGNWKLAAYKRGLLKQNPERTLEEMADMYDSTARLMEDTYGTEDPRLVGPLLGRAMAGYQLTELEMNKPLDDFESPGSRTHLRLVCRNVVTRLGIRRVCNPVATPDTNYFINQQGERSMAVTREMQQVGKALRRVVDIQVNDPTITPQELAQSLAHLGDWYQLNQKRQAARTAYTNAYQILASNDKGLPYLEELFGKPVRIPVLAIEGADVEKDLGIGEDLNFVTLEFVVTALGKAREIEVIDESNPDDMGARKYAKQHVKASMFRPRLVNGEPVDTDKVLLRLTGEYLERNSDETISSYSNPQPSSNWGSRIR